MFIVLLKFSANKSAAPDHMAGHNAWIAKGFKEGAFVLTGSLVPGLGGVVIANGEDREALWQRVQADPFVVEDVVLPEIHEVAPGRAIPELGFLTAKVAAHA